MLDAWVTAPVQQWLAATLPVLRGWQRSQADLLARRGLTVRASTASFGCAQLGVPAQALRRHGVQVRDTTSFGLPGWARLNTFPPPAQAALAAALDVELHAEIDAERGRRAP